MERDSIVVLKKMERVTFIKLLILFIYYYCFWCILLLLLLFLLSLFLLILLLIGSSDCCYSHVIAITIRWFLGAFWSWGIHLPS